MKRFEMTAARYFWLGVFFALLATNYASQVAYGKIDNAIMASMADNPHVAGSGVASGASGGAIGFSILSATCLIISEWKRKSN